MLRRCPCQGYTGSQTADVTRRKRQTPGPAKEHNTQTAFKPDDRHSAPLTEKTVGSGLQTKH